MKISKSVFVYLFAGTLIAAPAAFAATNLMKACGSDLKKFGCTVNSDAEAHECLEKNEKEGMKNEGFKAGCYKAHEAYEKKMGKEEAGEHEHPAAGESH